MMAVNFLRESGYQTTQKQVTCSCSLSDLNQLFIKILNRIDNGEPWDVKEKALVEEWSEAIKLEMETFDENIEQLIDEMERKDFERRQGKLKDEAVEKKD